MGALSRPGPQFGSKGPPAPSLGDHRSFFNWFPSFLQDELRPYPGRLTIVLRMTLAATLTMLAIMTFRLPGAAIAGYYTLLLSRESPVSTLRAAVTVMVMYVFGAAFSLVGLLLFLDYPLTHFLWVAFSLFLCFYVIKVTTNYVAAAAFAFIITIIIPIWDTTAPSAALVAATLWAAGSVSVGLLCTVAVEYLFAASETRDELATGLLARADAARDLFRALARGKGDTHARTQKVQQLAMVGVSRLRRIALAAASNGRGDPEQWSTTVSLVGRLVDIGASLPSLPKGSEDDPGTTLLQLADRLNQLRPQLLRTRPKAGLPPSLRPSSHPVLAELQRTVDLLQLSLTEASTASRVQKPSKGNNSLLLPDAFTNPDHLLYSLRGCLAAMLCYLVFNGIAWRGLSTSLATCLITALSSIGASRQKQILRLAGATVGGLILGIGAQVLILPMLDSVAGFAVLFAVVTFIAGWFATASPRLSYFGLQIALAFYLIHLQEPYPQTNLAIARDRVMGIALGLIMMWLVFDTLGSKPAAQVMREIFAANLRLLAKLAQPWGEGKAADLVQLRSLRDKISNNFASVNAQADAVLFEVGPNRQRDLRLRERLAALQPRLRTIFLLEAGILQYRAEVVPSELNPEIRKAQIEFDNTVSAVLQHAAEAFQTSAKFVPASSARDSFRELESAVKTAYGDRPTKRAQGVLAFSANLAELVDRLHADVSHFSE